MENFAIKGNPCEIQMQLTSMLLEDAFDRVIKSTVDRNKALIKIMTVNEGLKGVLGKMRGYISDHGGEKYIPTGSYLAHQDPEEYQRQVKELNQNNL